MWDFRDGQENKVWLQSLVAANTSEPDWLWEGVSQSICHTKEAEQFI